MFPFLPCSGAGGGGNAGGTVQAGGPLAEEEGRGKSSSDGLVKELLIWQHRALILLSPSSGNSISMSGPSKKRGHTRGGGQDSRRKDEMRRKG